MMNRFYAAFIVSLSSFFLPATVFGQGGNTSPSIRNPLPQDVTTITGFLNLIIQNIVLPIGAVVVVIMIIYTGFLFVTARGNEEQLTQAKTAFLWTIVGAAVLLGSLAISTAISGTLCQVTNNGIPGICP